ncbi:MAG: ribosome maturation factor RimP [Holosporales bacterium]|jgi:ribosome maturation factor RimP
MADAAKFNDEIQGFVESLGYRLVRLQMLQGRRGGTLQIMAEPLSGASMRIEDCESLSRMVSPWLDAHEPVAGAYTLEVSSPGIDRPLISVEDYLRYQSHVASVELREPLEGQKRFRGNIEGIENNAVLLTVSGSLRVLPLEKIRTAKLVLTDALLAFEQERLKSFQQQEDVL